MELDSLTVTWKGESQTLPQKEFMLLYKMISYPGKIFTRHQLMDEIWGYDNESDTHTVDVHIGRLRDNGPGISEEAREHIFTRFFQADSSHKQKGNGLGLALVDKILNLEKGKISVGNCLDGGCEFTVILQNK